MSALSPPPLDFTHEFSKTLATRYFSTLGLAFVSPLLPYAGLSRLKAFWPESKECSAMGHCGSSVLAELARRFPETWPECFVA